MAYDVQDASTVPERAGQRSRASCPTRTGGST